MRTNQKRQSHQKLLNYLDEFIDSDYFQDEVRKLRAKLVIPTQGLPMPKELEDNLNRTMPVYDIFQLPNELKNNGRNILKELNLAIRKMGKRIKIYDIDINYFIRTYVIYNKKILNIINHLTETDLAQIQDFSDILEEYPSYFTVDNIKGLFEYYPIIIKLHPSITQRDLVDYIQDRWPYIEFNLSQHRDKNSKIGKVKRKKAGIRERNDFIYQNKHLPSKEIMGMLYKKYGFNFEIDQGYIGKIISLEKKKRKEL